jgi:hypothetical protein
MDVVLHAVTRGNGEEVDKDKIFSLWVGQHSIICALVSLFVPFLPQWLNTEHCK